jgi:hypothetical protein
MEVGLQELKNQGQKDARRDESTPHFEMSEVIISKMVIGGSSSKTCRHRQVQMALVVSGLSFISPAPLFRCDPVLPLPALERKELSLI